MSPSVNTSQRGCVKLEPCSENKGLGIFLVPEREANAELDQRKCRMWVFVPTQLSLELCTLAMLVGCFWCFVHLCQDHLRWKG